MKIVREHIKEGFTLKGPSKETIQGYAKNINTVRELHTFLTNFKQQTSDHETDIHTYIKDLDSILKRIAKNIDKLGEFANFKTTLSEFDLNIKDYMDVDKFLKEKAKYVKDFKDLSNFFQVAKMSTKEYIDTNKFIKERVENIDNLKEYRNLAWNSYVIEFLTDINIQEVKDEILHKIGKKIDSVEQFNEFKREISYNNHNWHKYIPEETINKITKQIYDHLNKIRNEVLKLTNKYNGWHNVPEENREEILKEWFSFTSQIGLSGYLHPKKFKKGFKQMRILNFLRQHPNIRRKDLVKFIYELGYGKNTFDPKENGSYYSDAFGHRGWLGNLSDSSQGHYTITEEGIQKLKELARKFKYDINQKEEVDFDFDFLEFIDEKIENYNVLDPR